MDAMMGTQGEYTSSPKYENHALGDKLIGPIVFKR